MEKFILVCNYKFLDIIELNYFPSPNSFFRYDNILYEVSSVDKLKNDNYAEDLFVLFIHVPEYGYKNTIKIEKLYHHLDIGEGEKIKARLRNFKISKCLDIL